MGWKHQLIEVNFRSLSLTSLYEQQTEVLGLHSHSPACELQLCLAHLCISRAQLKKAFSKLLFLEERVSNWAEEQLAFESVFSNITHIQKNLQFFMTYLVISPRYGPLNCNLFHESLCSSLKWLTHWGGLCPYLKSPPAPFPAPQVQSWIIPWFLLWSSMHSSPGKYMVAHLKQLKWWKAQKEKKRKMSRESAP